MIKVYINKKEENVSKITIKGHSNFEDVGKDIVCAAFSSILITSINLCLKIDKEALNIKEGQPFEINILKDNEMIFKILDNMIEMFLNLEQDYPKNIKVL